MGNEILSLSTIVDKDTLTLASKRHPRGKSYDFVSRDDLSPLKHELLVTKYQEAATLLNAKRLTVAQESKLLALFGEVVRILVPRLEPTVLAELTIGQRSKVVKAWADNNGGGEDSPGPSERPTTAASARRSRGSTAATRKPGSTRRRGSSARTNKR